MTKRFQNQVALVTGGASGIMVDEVASPACWVVSKEASFNTGFVFDLSGGRATY